jgi:hypothetical protein
MVSEFAFDPKLTFPGVDFNSPWGTLLSVAPHVDDPQPLSAVYRGPCSCRLRCLSLSLSTVDRCDQNRRGEKSRSAAKYCPTVQFCYVIWLVDHRASLELAATRQRGLPKTTITEAHYPHIECEGRWKRGVGDVSHSIPGSGMTSRISIHAPGILR